MIVSTGTLLFPFSPMMQENSSTSSVWQFLSELKLSLFCMFTGQPSLAILFTLYENTLFDSFYCNLKEKRSDGCDSHLQVPCARSLRQRGISFLGSHFDKQHHHAANTIDSKAGRLRVCEKKISKPSFESSLGRVEKGTQGSEPCQCVCRSSFWLWESD